MLLKRLGLHLCPSPACPCRLGESPAWTSPNLDSRRKGQRCGHSYGPLLYGVSYTTKADHFCPHTREGGIYCLTSVDANRTRKALVQQYNSFPGFGCWLLEVGSRGRTIGPRGRLSHMDAARRIQLEQVRGIRFLIPLCIYCNGEVEQGFLILRLNSQTSFHKDKLFPTCPDHPTHQEVWGEFKYDGLEIHTTPLQQK